MHATIMTAQLPTPPTPVCQLVTHRILNEQRQKVHLRELACSQEHDNTVMAARDESLSRAVCRVLLLLPLLLPAAGPSQCDKRRCSMRLATAAP